MNQSCNTLQVIRQSSFCSPELPLLFLRPPDPLQSKSHRIRAEVSLGFRGGSVRGDVGG